MAGHPIKRAQMRLLDDIGEESIVAMIEDGTTLRQFFDAFSIHRRAWYAWLDSKDGRREAMEDARAVFAESLDAESMKIADECEPDRDEVAVAKLRIEARRFRADAVDKSRREKTPPPSTVINIANLHLDALRERMDVTHALPPIEEDDDVVEADWEEEDDD